MVLFRPHLLLPPIMLRLLSHTLVCLPLELLFPFQIPLLQGCCRLYEPLSFCQKCSSVYESLLSIMIGPVCKVWVLTRCWVLQYTDSGLQLP